MVRNLTPQNIYELITGDFEGAWDSVAANHSQIARCNFMFARHAMNLLEFASILCESDSSKQAIQTLSVELKKKDIVAGPSGIKLLTMWIQRMIMLRSIVVLPVGPY